MENVIEKKAMNNVAAEVGDVESDLISIITLCTAAICDSTDSEQAAQLCGIRALAERSGLTLERCLDRMGEQQTGYFDQYGPKGLHDVS